MSRMWGIWVPMLAEADTAVTGPGAGPLECWPSIEALRASLRSRVVTTPGKTNTDVLWAADGRAEPGAQFYGGPDSAVLLYEVDDSPGFTPDPAEQPYGFVEFGEDGGIRTVLAETHSVWALLAGRLRTHVADIRAALCRVVSREDAADGYLLAGVYCQATYQLADLVAAYGPLTAARNEAVAAARAVEDGYGDSPGVRYELPEDAARAAYDLLVAAIRRRADELDPPSTAPEPPGPGLTSPPDGAALGDHDGWHEFLAQEGEPVRQSSDTDRNTGLEDITLLRYRSPVTGKTAWALTEYGEHRSREVLADHQDVLEPVYEAAVRERVAWLGRPMRDSDIDGCGEPAPAWPDFPAGAAR
ncbi:hypothetical protein ACWGMW_16305 [Streptomyces albidoflavus]